MSSETAMNPEVIIRLSNITKHYRDKKALQDVSLSLKRGRIYGLIGKNGAGKTTLIRIMSKLSLPDSGTVKTVGHIKSSYIVELPAFFAGMNAVENMETRAILQGTPFSRIKPLLAIAGLSDTGKKPARDFSLGMKQRLGIALSLLCEPDFLVLDEPTNGLDPEGVADFRNLIKKIRDDTGATVLVSSHQLSELALYADEFVFIHGGRLIEQIPRSTLEKRVRKAVTLSVSDPDAALRILDVKLGVKNADAENGYLIIHEDISDISIIPQILVENGIRIFSLEHSHATLEEYFLALIERKGDTN
jgi:ABC-2 type transport system ATP-binding protein